MQRVRGLRLEIVRLIHFGAMTAPGQDRTFKHGRFMPLGDPVQQPVSRIDSLPLHSPQRKNSDGFAIADNHLTFSKIIEHCRPCP